MDAVKPTIATTIVFHQIGILLYLVLITIIPMINKIMQTAKTGTETFINAKSNILLIVTFDPLPLIHWENTWNNFIYLNHL